MLEKTKESITTLYKQAQAYADNKEYEKADAILIKIITLQPQNSYEWGKQGFAFKMLDKPQKAINNI